MSVPGGPVKEEGGERMLRQLATRLIGVYVVVCNDDTATVWPVSVMCPSSAMFAQHFLNWCCV